MSKQQSVFKTPESNLQAFVRLLRLAHEASEAVDYFDLNCDEKSKRRWQVLLKEEQAAFNKLHAFCQKCPVEDLKVGA
jgi:hypothetical protein